MRALSEALTKALTEALIKELIEGPTVEPTKALTKSLIKASQLSPIPFINPYQKCNFPATCTGGYLEPRSLAQTLFLRKPFIWGVGDLFRINPLLERTQGPSLWRSP